MLAKVLTATQKTNRFILIDFQPYTRQIGIPGIATAPQILQQSRIVGGWGSMEGVVKMERA